MEYPEAFARFYDLMYNQLRDSVDKIFFLERIRAAKGKVLDVGVGTGRFFLDALGEGADVYGIDISRSMLKVLEAKLDSKHMKRISLQDIVDFRFDFLFDLIVAPFRVMMHLHDKEQQLEAINNVYKHLAKGGEFIFDAFVPDLGQLIGGIKDHTDFEGEYKPGRKLRRTVSTEPVLIRQLINVSFRLEWDEVEGSRVETWDTALRYFFRYELEHLIERSDFTEYKILGDYQGNELQETSKEFVVVCRKS